MYCFWFFGSFFLVVTLTLCCILCPWALHMRVAANQAKLIPVIFSRSKYISKMSKESNHWLQPERNDPTALHSQLRKQPFHDRNKIPTDSKSGDDGAGKWLPKLEFLKEMIVGVDLLLVIVAASGITIFVNQIEDKWLSFLSESKAAIATLGAFYVSVQYIYCLCL